MRSKLLVCLCILAVINAAYGDKPIQPLVIGGENATIQEAPFMLSVRENNKHICGAVVISISWALTAAHCVQDYGNAETPPLTVRAGSAHEDVGGSIHRIVKVVVAPSFNSTTHEYDYALLKVGRPFPTRDGVYPIKLPKCWSEPKTGTSGKIFGWGKTKINKQFSQILQKGVVSVIDRLTCKTLPNKNRKEFDAKMICAQEKYVDSCKGDEGGPLVINNLLVGIGSFGIGCGDPKYPGVYGNVGNYDVLMWINKYTGLSGLPECI